MWRTLKAHLPELPDEKKARFMRDFALSAYDAGVLVGERETADYFEAVAKGRDAKAAANWVINEHVRPAQQRGQATSRPLRSAPRQLGAILDLIADNTISGKIAKDLFEIVWSEGGDPRAIVEKRGMKQVTDTAAIEKAVDEIIAKNPDKVADAKTNPKAIGWFVGQVMKAVRRQGEPASGQRHPEKETRTLNCARQSRASIAWVQCGSRVQRRRAGSKNFGRESVAAGARVRTKTVRRRTCKANH